MSAPPTRCCAPATSGRCSNAPAPYGQSRYIGVVEIAACNHPKHQAALRSLPDFQRRAGVCGADDCGKAAESGLCPEHRQLYRRHGVNVRALLATIPEVPVTEPTPEAVVEFLCEPKPPAAPKESSGEGAPSEPHPLETRRDALVERLLAAGFDEGRRPAENLRRFHHDPKVVVLIPDGHPCEVEGDFATLLDKAEEQCARVERAAAPPATVEDFLRDLESGDGERSVGDVNDAYSGRWGQYTVGIDPATGQECTAVRVVVPTLDGLAALAARGQQPTAPGSTVAELHAVCLLMQQLGSYGPDASAMLMRLLPVESRRALLEIEASDARGELARARANVVNPPPPERVAELTAKVATLDARIAALDAG